MRLGLITSFPGSTLNIDINLIRLAEDLGFDSVWTMEAWGADAATPLAWIAAQTTKIRLGTAIMQMPARTPALTAMTAMTLDELSGGRFILGLGPSGPQVAEGWYGVPYGKPLARTREYVSIMRKIFAREEKLVHEGEHYCIPITGEGTTGLGKPLKTIFHPRKDLPIYTASISPNGLVCSAEVADGLIPAWLSPQRMDLVLPHLEKGFARAGDGKSLGSFSVAPFVLCLLGDDLEKCRIPAKMLLAHYIGGMGARTKNLYNDFAVRLGYEEAAAVIQDLYLDGKKAEAMAAVPDQLVDEVALVGSRERIADRAQIWKTCGVSDMLIGGASPEALEVLAECLL